MLPLTEVSEQILQKIGLFEACNFIPISGDASQKQFFKVLKGDQSTPYLLLRFPGTAPRSDESFIIDNNPTDIKQDDYFVAAARFLSEKNMPMTPRFYDWDQTNRLVLIEDVGQTSLNDILSGPKNQSDRVYLDAIQWICRLQRFSTALPKHGDTHSAQLLRNRVFEEQAMMCEMDEFFEWVVPISLTGSDKEELRDSLCNLIKSINAQPKCYVHRDFQSRNIMVKGSPGDPYVIDTQDLCIGPQFYDIASLLYDANAQLSQETIDKYAMIYYKYSPIRLLSEKRVHGKIDEVADKAERERYMKRLRETGLQRVLKNMGRHAKYSIRDKRDASTKYLVKNRKVYELIRDNMLIYDDYKKLFILLDPILLKN